LLRDHKKFPDWNKDPDTNPDSLLFAYVQELGAFSLIIKKELQAALAL